MEDFKESIVIVGTIFFGIFLLGAGIAVMANYSDNASAQRRKDAVAMGCIALDDHVFCEGRKQ